MINIKKLLGKILSQIQTLQATSQKTLWAWKWWNGSTNQKTYNTIYYPSSFGGSSSGFTNDSDIFVWGVDGCTVRKPGYYFVTVNGHINCSTDVRVRVQLYNNRTGAIIGPSCFFDNGGRGYMPYSISAIAKVGTEPVGICPRYLKYSPNNSTSTFRPTLIYMSIIFLSDLKPGES